MLHLPRAKGSKVPGNGCSFLVNMLPAKSIIWEAYEIRVHEKDETSVNMNQKGSERPDRNAR